MDVSGSMYRFNGQDRRLERMLEAVLLILEAMPSPGSGSSGSTVEYALTGHSGDRAEIPFLDFDQSKPSQEGERFAILESLAAHAQYAQSGDYTLKATELAIRRVVEGTEFEEQAERFVFVVSDANFERYGISPKTLSKVMMQDPRVQTHLILIASLGNEAEEIARFLPAGRVHIAFENKDLPSIFRRILTSIGGAFDG